METEKINNEVKKENTENTNIYKTDTLNILVNNLYDCQKVRISTENRNRALQEKEKEEIFKGHVAQLKKLEKDIVKEMDRELSQFEISKWMLGQRGIGPSLAGQTIALIRDVGRFSNISKLWSYSGMGVMEVCRKCGKRHLDSPKREEWIVRVANRLKEQNEKKKIIKEAELEFVDEGALEEDKGIKESDFTSKAKAMLCKCEKPDLKVVAQRRIKNTIIDYNPKMKKLCRNIAMSLIQYNQFYGDMYNGFLQTYNAREDLLKGINTEKYKESVLEKIKTSRATKMARRKMIKVFLSHLWLKWRKLEGLPVTKPWIIERGGHSDFIEPPE